MISFRVGKAAVCGVVAALALTGCWQTSASAAEEAKPKITFGPEVEPKLSELFAKLREVVRRRWAERMRIQIQQVTEVTGLGPEGAEALEKPAETAAELSLEVGLAKSEVQFRKQFGQQPEQIVEMVEQMLPQLELVAQNESLPDESDPTDQPVWKEALRQTLSADQLAAWEKAVAARKQTLSTEIAGVLKASVEQMREQQATAILARSSEIKAALTLPEERARQLDALGKDAAAKAADRWRGRAEKVLVAMPDAQRRLAVKNGNFFIPPDDDDAPDRQPAWKEGLAKLLTPQETVRLEGALEGKKARRTRAMGQLILMLFDEKTALTASQREHLLPVAERIAKSQPMLFPEGGPEAYFSFSPQALLNAGAQIAAPELDSTLDPPQRKRWQEAANTKLSNIARGQVVMARKAAAVAKPAAPVPEPEPEHFEHVIADFLHERSEGERKRIVATMTLKAEDAARVAGLAAEPAARLQAAARGTAEQSLRPWKAATHEQVRAVAADATPRNVRQVLDSMEDYQFRRNNDTAPEKSSLWEQTVRTALDDAQRAAWQKEEAERESYRLKAIAGAILAEFDRRISLSDDQWQKLELMIGAFMQEYGPDIAGMFSSSNSTPWFMQTYSMFLPFAGIPEKKLKAVLANEQWERWKGSEWGGNSNNYWESVQQNHEQRVKNQKK